MRVSKRKQATGRGSRTKEMDSAGQAAKRSVPSLRKAARGKTDDGSFLGLGKSEPIVKGARKAERKAKEDKLTYQMNKPLKKAASLQHKKLLQNATAGMAAGMAAASSFPSLMNKAANKATQKKKPKGAIRGK